MAIGLGGNVNSAWLRPTFTVWAAVTGLAIAGCAGDGDDPLTSSPATTSSPAAVSSSTSPPPTSAGEAVGVEPVVDGIGDPYYPTLGNTGYDVDHYDIDLAFEPPSAITATVAIDAVATDDVAVFNLDFAGFDIIELSVDGDDAPYARRDGELTIQPARPISNGDRFAIQISYTGTPVAGYSAALPSRVGWLVSTSGQQYVASQPDGAHTWLPVNDHPSDKATYTYRITVPTPLVAAANGVLTSTVTDDDATTWTWDMAQPMASHVATVVIGDYQLITDPAASQLADVEIRHLLTPDLADDPPPILGQLGEMITVLEEFFGPYPFDAYGVALIDPFFSPALETQTLSLFSRMLLDERVMVHELAHQWFGNHVSVERWQDIWISESFATYAEYLWIEATQGRDAMNDAIATDQAMLDIVDPPPAAEPPPGDLYNLAVYQVGARALHDIRLEVGDDTFFEILTTFVDRFGGSTATADDFIDLTNQLAGRDLTPIFDDWLNDTNLPDLDLQ